MTIILILFASLAGLLAFAWIKEARILLALYHRCVFSSAPTANLFEEKELLFPNHRLLEDNWLLIRNELWAFTEKNRQLPRFHEVDAANHKISFDAGPAWQTIVLKAYDNYFLDNCRNFSFTCALLHRMPEVSTAMFSILQPGVHIPTHTGKFKGVLRYHLALEVPASDNCFMMLDKDKINWQEGKGLLFDDTYLHSVTNHTNQQRVVLFLDIKKRSNRLTTFINNLILKTIVISPVFKRAARKGTINIG